MAVLWTSCVHFIEPRSPVSINISDTVQASKSLHSISFSVLSPPPNVSCILLSSPGAAEVSLSWSPSFTSQHAVERYRVSVSPNPSSCSCDQVSPSEDYSCSGLVPGQMYNFTVSAINCGGQEGEDKTFFITLNGLNNYSSTTILICRYLCFKGPNPPSIVNVSALYTGNSLSYNLQEIQVTWKYSEDNEDITVIIASKIDFTNN